MNKNQVDRSKKSCICSLESNNTTVTAEPVYYSQVRSIMENPFERLDTDMKEVKMLLRVLIENQQKPIEKSDLIGLKEACVVLHISSSSLYKMTAKNTIPFIKREGSKKLLFSRAKLQTWLEKSQPNLITMEKQIDEHLHRKLRVRKVQNN